MSLVERFDAVERARRLSDRSWSLRAKLSERYVHVARDRAKKDPAYVLPEKGARALADAADVSVEWLRDGRGAMERAPAAAVGAPEKALPEAVELAFFDAISQGRVAAEDGVAARRILEAGHHYVPPARDAAAQAIGRLLEAIARVRSAGLPTTQDALLWHLLGPSPPAVKGSRAA